MKDVMFFSISSHILAHLCNFCLLWSQSTDRIFLSGLSMRLTFSPRHLYRRPCLRIGYGFLDRVLQV